MGFDSNVTLKIVEAFLVCPEGRDLTMGFDSNVSLKIVLSLFWLAPQSQAAEGRVRWSEVCGGARSQSADILWLGEKHARSGRASEMVWFSLKSLWTPLTWQTAVWFPPPPPQKKKGQKENVHNKK